MAVPQPADSMATYVVYRDIQPGEPFDPTSPLLFFPPKGSDELFDALRQAFPHTKTHSERMREAVIQYLLEERQDEQSQQTSPAMTVDNAFPSVSSGSATSLLSTPELLNFSTPASFAPSPQLQAAHQLTRQPSTATTSSQPSPPAIDQMTSVFSLSTSNQPKQRIRRKMTEAEKVEYRKRRIVKACDKCAKRKRKCPHNKAEMETLTSAAGASGSRVSKSASPKSTKAPPSAEQEVVLDPSLLSMQEVDFASFDFSEFPPVDDFDLFSDPFHELGVNEMLYGNHSKPANEYQPRDLFTPELSPMLQEWQFDQYQDATLLGPISSDRPTVEEMSWFSLPSSGPEFSGNSADLDRHLMLQTNGLARTSTESDDNMTSSTDALSSADSHLREYGNVQNLRRASRVQLQVEGGSQPTSTEAEMFSKRFTRREAEIGAGSGSIVLWEHLRAGQQDIPLESGNATSRKLTHAGQSEKPVPTHTAHVHDSECGGLNGLDVADRTTNVSTLPETVLRLTGTKKAIMMFGGRCNQHVPSISGVTMESVCHVLKLHNDGITHVCRPNRPPIPDYRPLSEIASLYDVNKRESSMPDSDIIWQERGPQTDLGVSGHEQGLAYTSVSVPSGSRSAAQQGRPSSSQPLRQTIRNQPTLHQRQDQLGESSPGEGLSKYADPRMQLYMARKRLSSNVTTRVGRSIDIHLATSAQQSTNPRLLATIARALPGDGVASSILQHGTTTPADTASAPGPPRYPLQALAQPTATQSTAVSEDRLSDHFRFRDHHGRVEGPSAYPLAVIFGCSALLILGASLLTLGPALLFAAVLLLQQQTATGHWSLEKILHCTVKNSRWLSFASLVQTKYGLARPRRSEKGSFLSCKDGRWLRALCV